ncbi:DUF1178 family protein [Sphingoaurantiacus capsulatus]|uniref:DUF1178 family protein n=1 Tax=Sphingoaurantiacus capsulatus TaxID=1771310 RepID=A0ABV7XA89_9SPHN
MIVFDLRCAHAHVFEAWFGSTEDYDDQRTRGLVTCPLCGDAEVTKAAMAPAVPAKGNRAPAGKQPVAAHPPEAVKAMLAAIAEVQAKVEANCDYVGNRFADEARAIHHGDAEERGIYGEATVEQAAALKDEGIDVAALPFKPKRVTDA